MELRSAKAEKRGGGTWAGLLLPLLLTLVPVLMIGHELRLRIEARQESASRAWQQEAQTVARRWNRASTLGFWAETFAARFRHRFERRLTRAAVPHGPPSPSLLGGYAGDVRREALPKGFPPPRIWLFALSASPDEAPRPVTGPGFETLYGRLIGSLFHEIDRRERFEPGRPRPASWKQTLDRMFGFGASPELFDVTTRGAAFPVLFQGQAALCVWDQIRHDGEPVAMFLAIIPSNLEDHIVARRLCFANWNLIAGRRQIEPVFFPFPLAASAPIRPLVRPHTSVTTEPGLRNFLRRKASQLRFRPAGSPRDPAAGDIDTWYLQRQLYNSIGEIRLPDHELGLVLEAGQRHLACWVTLDTLAGGLGLLIGRTPRISGPGPVLAGTGPFLLWLVAWGLVLLRAGLSHGLPAFGIRTQLAFWFLCLASLPLVTALSETDKLLTDLRQNLLRQYDQELSQALQELENENAALTQRFTGECRRHLGKADLVAALADSQCAGRSATTVFGGLWNRLSESGLPLRSLTLFGHGGLEMSRHDARISPELGTSLVNFLRPPAQSLLRQLSPGLDARFRVDKPRSSGALLENLVTASKDEMTQRNRQLGETMAGNQRLLKFHQFLERAGETWFVAVVFWEQSEAYIRHIRPRITGIAARHQADLEVTRRTPDGDLSVARSAGPLHGRGETTRSSGGARIVSRPSGVLPGFHLTAARPLAPLARQLAAETRRVVAGVAGNLLLLFLAGGALAAWLTTPLMRMVTALRDVAAGQLDRNLGMNREDELGRTAGTLDAMTDWLRERRAMSLFVAPQVLEAVSGDPAGHAPRKRALVALVSDIRSFTTLSESHPPETVFEALNRHFRAMTPAIKAEGGIIDRFIGDAIQAVFYESDGSEPAARRALLAARRMMSAHGALQADRAAAGRFTYGIGVGVAAGEAVCGVIGTEQVRQDYSVVGEVIKQAGELEAASKAGRATLIICDDAVVSASGTPEAFLPVPGHPGAFEALADDIAFQSPASPVGLSSADAPPPPASFGEVPSDKHAESGAWSGKQLAFLCLLAAGLVYSAIGMLTTAWRERALARESTALRHDLRLLSSTNEPVLQISHHLTRTITGPRPDRTSFAGVMARLRRLRHPYPGLAWCVFRHIPGADAGPAAITAASTRLVEAVGEPFATHPRDTVALLSSLKMILTEGSSAPSAASRQTRRTSEFLGLPAAEAGAKVFDAYANLTQCNLASQTGFLLWYPLPRDGWWDEHRRMTEAGPLPSSHAARWWTGLRGGVLLFLPARSVNAASGFRALRANLAARGTRLVSEDLLATFPGSESDRFIRRSATLEHHPGLTAIRPLPQPPAWMGMLDLLLTLLTGLLIIGSILLAFSETPSWFARLLPSGLIPRLAAAFVLALAPSLVIGWLAGERRLLERQARLLDETSDRIHAELSCFDEGMSWYISHNMNTLRHLATRPDLSRRIEQIARIPDPSRKQAEVANLMEEVYRRSWASCLTPGNMHAIGPGGISGIIAITAADQANAHLRELFECVYNQVMRRISPAFLTEARPGGGKDHLLDDLKGEEIKYLLLSLLPPREFATLMAAPIAHQLLVWGLNSHETFRIYAPDGRGAPLLALQLHLTDKALLLQQLRNRWEEHAGTGRSVPSMTGNDLRIAMPFTTVTMKQARTGERFTAEARTFLADPVSIETDMLAGTARIPVHTVVGSASSATLLVAVPGERQREFILRGRLPYGIYLERLKREADGRRAALVLLLLLTIYTAFRTAARFLEPVRALDRAAGEIMRERFETRLPTNRRDEFGLLAQAFNAMAQGVEEGRRLRMFVSDAVRSAATDEARSRAARAGESRQAAVLFAAPAGFGSLLHERTPESLVALLNRHLTVLSGMIRSQGGEIDKFIGEKILAVFDAERYGDLERASRAAAAAARNMSEAAARLEGGLALPLGIGIVSGPVLAGIMGTPEVRLEYTVIGDTVNSAARLCELALKGGGGIVLDTTTATAIAPTTPGRIEAGSVTPVGEILVKGKARRIPVFRLA
ncbi:MAG TPA: adenylate/guanylate cyclase domain-containing protein [Candidatus Ozemobacteraceae bacterium]|nr:adenylate/guanylate cyclase domain-containing protein [Candidatus Ozemobacteraceae bacterium]